MAAHAPPQARPTARSGGPAQRAARLQPKLEVGPSHDRFEAEADRVAASVVSQAGPSAPPAISALGSATGAQREEKRTIDQREKKPDPGHKALSELIQSKAEPGGKREDRKAQTKPAAKPKPEEKVQQKPAPKLRPDEHKVQTKKHPNLGRKQEDPVDQLVQSKTLGARVQRDDVDDDTVLETTIQSKAAAQRANQTVDGKVKQEEPKPGAKPAQRAARGGDGFDAPKHVETGISAMRGRGTPLSPALRGQMEPRFGRDLSGVRVHSGAQAAQLSNDIHARAFTIGQDIFFGAGQYQPATSDGQALLAHEVTHTIQQSGGSARAQPARIQPSRIQRTPPGPAASATTGSPPPAAGPSGSTAATAVPPSTTFPVPATTRGTGRIDVTEGKKDIIMSGLPLPQIDGVHKGTGAGAAAGPNRDALVFPWVFKGKSPRNASKTARDAWLDNVGPAETGIRDKIAQMATVANGGTAPPADQVVYLRSRIGGGGRAQNFLLIGTVSELAATPRMRIPIWDSTGGGALFDVDHKQELQIGGLDGITNMWLLEETTNRSSGGTIKSQMRSDFESLMQAATTAGFFTANSLTAPTWDEVRSRDGPLASGQWNVTYQAARSVSISGTNRFWNKADITAGLHLDRHMEALDHGEMVRLGLIYTQNPTRKVANIFSTQNLGGYFRRVDYSNMNNVVPQGGEGAGGGGFGAGAAVPGAGNQLFRGFAVGTGGFRMRAMAPVGSGSSEERALLGGASEEAMHDGDIIATVTGQPFPASGKIEADPMTLNVIWQRRFGMGGYIDAAGVATRLARLNIHGMSPITISDACISAQGELYANGEITATKALFPNLRVPIYMRGNEIGSASDPTESLNFGPIHVTEAALDVGFDANGVFIGGHAGVAIDHVGAGTIIARHNSTDTTLEGDFNFDLDFLDPAHANLKYSFAHDTLELTLNAGIKEGVLPGVASGTVTGRFSREAVDLSGTLNLAAPLTGSTVTLGYTRETGLTIAADNIPLPVSRIPGVQDATLSARANYNPDDGSWHLSGEGRANFSVPPATGTLTVGLDGPVVTIHGTAAFQQGIAAGSLDVTATNAELDAQGQPVPGRTAPTFSVFGHGQASLTFGILTGTAALELTREGQVIITGTIAMPPTYEVFPRRSYDRELLHVEPPEIPIWGFSLAGIGVGVFAFFDARLTANAFVGPGTLQNTQVSVTFDLAHPEEAVVDGSAAFVVPAGAGMTLDIGGGLRARAAVAYVQGRIGLDATLGLEAEARADVNVHWSRDEGLALAASAHAEAHPKFEVGVNASVTAGVDLGLFDVSKTFGPWRRVLGSFGPDMAVGVTMPIAWSERGGLDFSADRAELTYPDIDFGALMTDGFMQLVD